MRSAPSEAKPGPVFPLTGLQAASAREIQPAVALASDDARCVLKLAASEDQAAPERAPDAVSTLSDHARIGGGLYVAQDPGLRCLAPAAGLPDP